MKVVASFLPLWLLVSQTFPATVNASTIPDSPTAEAPAVVWDRELQVAPFDICYVCGDGKVVTLPDVSTGLGFSVDEVLSCAQMENRGLSGQLPPPICLVMPTLIGATCGCLTSTEAPVMAPISEAPIIAPVPDTQAPMMPTELPTMAYTDRPTKAPTESPTKAPTERPTKAPTESPTKAPTERPTKAPTLAPVTAAPQRKTRKPNKKTNIKKPKPNSKG